MAKNRRLPENIIADWPEIFKDVEFKILPIQYLHSIRVQFQDGRVWDIDVEKTISKKPQFDISKELETLFDQYEDVIANVDFRLNVERLKDDVTRRTKYFMKKRK